MFCKKGVFRNFAKLAGKHLCQSLFFNKAAGLQLYWKRDSGTGVFLWILWNFLVHFFLQNTSGDCFLISILMVHRVVSSSSKQSQLLVVRVSCSDKFSKIYRKKTLNGAFFLVKFLFLACTSSSFRTPSRYCLCHMKFKNKEFRNKFKKQKCRNLFFCKSD